MPYGIATKDQYLPPSSEEAGRMLNETLDLGVNMIDTARLYGDSETLIGKYLHTRRQELVLATKVAVSPTSSPSAVVSKSLDRSLRELRTETVDILYLHSASSEVISEPAVEEALAEEIERGRVRFLGATVYGEQAALDAIAAGYFDCLQIPYNMLDQEAAKRIFPLSVQRGIGLIARSTLLKGVFTPKLRDLPNDLKHLGDATRELCRALEVTPEELPIFAIRFCLTAPEVASALIGTIRSTELRLAIDAMSEGPLSAGELGSIMAVKDAYSEPLGSLLDPSDWPRSVY